MHRNVNRNDVHDALAYISECDGDLSEEDAEQLLMLQDDPTEYAARAAELLAELGGAEPEHDPGPVLHYTPKRST